MKILPVYGHLTAVVQVFTKAVVKYYIVPVIWNLRNKLRLQVILFFKMKHLFMNIHFGYSSAMLECVHAYNYLYPYTTLFCEKSEVRLSSYLLANLML